VALWEQRTAKDGFECGATSDGMARSCWCARAAAVSRGLTSVWMQATSASTGDMADGSVLGWAAM
jgi:hypothetical protein